MNSKKFQYVDWAIYLISFPFAYLCAQCFGPILMLLLFGERDDYETVGMIISYLAWVLIFIKSRDLFVYVAIQGVIRTNQGVLT